MTREELKNEIASRLEIMGDEELIEYYNEEHGIKIYKDIDDLFDEHCTCFAHALECLAPGFNYSPYGGYYAWDGDEISSADSIGELIDIDDLAECVMTRLWKGHYPDSDAITDLMDEYADEANAIKAGEVLEEIRFLEGKRKAIVEAEREITADIADHWEVYRGLTA